MKYLSLPFLLVLSVVHTLTAQTGSICDQAYNIASLPFSLSNYTTEGMGNNYDDTLVCNSNYMSGNEFVFSYTPPEDQFVSIVLTDAMGTEVPFIGNAGNVGLFVLKGCPDDTSSQCVDYAEALQGNPELETVFLMQDSAYFIIVSTNELFGQNPTTAFSISIEQVFPYDISVENVTSPQSAYNLSANEILTAVYKNSGTDTIFECTLGYVFQGDTTEVVLNDTLLPLETIQHSFTSLLDLSVYGQYSIDLFAEITGDANLSNNHLNYTVENIEPQEGELCSSAVEITSLPYIAAGLSTESFTSEYDANDACGSSYMTGNDYVFTYTPGTDQYVSIKLYNAEGVFNMLTMDNIGQVGLFVTEGCPDDPTSVCVAKNEAQEGNPVLDGVLLSAGVQYFIVVSTNDLFGQNSYTEFSIQIAETYQCDAGVVEFISPKSGYELSSMEPVSIRVKNYGLDTLTNLNVAYTLVGNSPVVETITDSILPGQTYDHTFTYMVDLSDFGTYTFTATTQLACDQSLVNNNSIQTVINSEFPEGSNCQHAHNITTLPYTETGLSTAAMPNSYSVTDGCNSIYMGGNDYVFSYTAEDNLNLMITLSNAQGSFSVATMDYLGMVGVFVLDACPDDTTANCIASAESQGGNPVLENVNVQFGETYYIVVSTSDLLGQNSYTDFDIDIRAVYTNDMEALGIVSPSSGSDLGQETIVGRFVNNGVYPAVNFDLGFEIGDSVIMEYYTDTVQPGDTLEYSFVSLADLSVPGRIYDIRLFVQYTLDVNASNNSIIVSVQNLPGAGASCDNYYDIQSVPFEITGLTTFGFVNDYNEADVCNSEYMNKNDFVFRYMATSSNMVNIFVSNTNGPAGIFVTKGCPDILSSQCVDYEESAGDVMLDSVSLNAWTIYYFIVSSNTLDTLNFDFSIIETAASVQDRWIDKVEVFPVPAKDILYVNNLPAGIKKITINDLTGRIFYTNETDSKDTKLQVESLGAGVYNLTIDAQGEFLVKKITIINP